MDCERRPTVRFTLPKPMKKKLCVLSLLGWAVVTLVPHRLHAVTALGVAEAEPAGEITGQVPVNLTSDSQAFAMQVDVLFDSVFYAVSDAQVGEQPDGVIVSSSEVEPGVLRVVVHHRSNLGLSNDVVFRVPLVARNGLVADYPVVLTNYLVVGPGRTALATSLAPRVKLLGLKDGKELNGRPGIELTVDARATASTITRVEYFIGGVSLGDGVGANFRLVWQPSVNGPYQVTAIAHDSNGVQASSSTTDVIVGHVGTFTLSAIKGTYVGLLRDDTASHAGSGFVTMTSATTGGFTLKVLIGGKPYSTSGKIDAVTGMALATLKRAKGLTPLNVRLTHSTDPSVDQIVGLITDGEINGPSVTGGTFKTEFVVDRLVWDGKLRLAPQAGKYTVLMPAGTPPPGQAAPLGDGYATMSVSTAGKAVISGKLADGTGLTQTTNVSKEGKLPVFGSLYAGKGMTSGWFQFADSEGVSDGAAILDWERLPDVKAKQFAAGFDTNVQLLASKYAVPIKNKRMLTMANLGGNLRGVFEGGQLAKPLERIATVSGSNVVAVPLQGGEKLVVKMTGSTGLLSGSFVHPNTGVSVPFMGAAFQKQNLGAGYFLSGPRGGGFTLDPNPQFELTETDANPLGVSTLPAIAIKVPKSEFVLPAGAQTVTVSGTASDKNGIARVEYQVLHNGVLGDATVATGTTAWSFPITVASGQGGRYTVFAKSVDTVGEQSNVATLSFRVMQTSDLVVTVAGPGAVSKGFLGTTSQEVGKLYTLTASPAAKKKFVGWTGSVTSTGRTISFVMEPGFSVEATFSD